MARKSIIINDLPELFRFRIACELEETSLQDVLSFAQTSKALRKTALARIYHSIELIPCLEEGKDKTTYHALIDLFRHDDQCEIARHVCSITVHDGIPTEDVVLMSEKIAGRRTLRKLR